MSDKIQVATSHAPAPAGPYSQGIRCGHLLFTAGVGPQDPVTGEVPQGVAAQTRRVLTSIREILDSAHATMNDVVKVTVHLADLGDFGEFNEAYREFFTEPFPVRTTVGSTLSGIAVEIDVVAYLPEESVS